MIVKKHSFFERDLQFSDLWLLPLSHCPMAASFCKQVFVEFVMCISPFQQIIFLGGSGQVGLPRSHVSRSLPAVRPAVSCSSAGRLNILGINRLLPVFLVFFLFVFFLTDLFSLQPSEPFHQLLWLVHNIFLATLSFWQLLCDLCEKLINWLID